MAEKRMFAKTIIDSDNFLDMPLSAQALYFHLSMRADDEGFVNNPKKIQRMIGCNDDDIKVLTAKKYILPFESGIIVIRHWRIHNVIRKDRLIPTSCIKEKSQLTVDSNVYECQSTDSQMSVKCQTTDSQMSVKCQSDDRQLSDNCQTNDSQVTDKCLHRLDKIRLDQIRLDKNNINVPVFSKKTDTSSSFSAEVEEIITYFNEKMHTKYRAKSKSTQKHIIARLKEGFKVEDFKTVIDKMITAWKNTEFEQYLTPDTLFSSKFEKYLNRTDKTSAELKSEQTVKDKYQMLYEWANESEGDEGEQNRISADCDNDRNYIPDFSTTN